MCGRSAVDFGVVVDEGEVLALLIGISGGIFIRVRDRHGVYFMIYYPFYHEGLSHEYHLSGIVDGGGAGLFGGIYIAGEATGTGTEAGADFVVGRRRSAQGGGDCRGIGGEYLDAIPGEAGFCGIRSGGGVE